MPFPAGAARRSYTSAGVRPHPDVARRSAGRARRRADGHGAGRRHGRDGRGQRVTPRRGRRPDGAVGAPAAGTAWLGPRPVGGHAAPRRCRDVRRAGTLAAVVARAGAGPGRPHRRFAADPQRRHHRGQPRHVLAGGRRTPRPRRPGRRRRGALSDRTPRRAGRRVHGRCQAHGVAARRADHRRDRAGARRVAGLRQGRHPQRHGHRHRQRLSRRRPAEPVGAPGPRVGRTDGRAAPVPPSRSWPVPPTGRPDRSPPPTPIAPVRWPPRRPARSTTTGPLPPTAGGPSRSSPAASSSAPFRFSIVFRTQIWAQILSRSARPTGDRRERGLPVARQRTQPRRGRLVGRRELAVRAAASGSGCSGRKAPASKASADRAPCSSTATWSARASCWRPALWISRSRPSRAWPSRARRRTCSGPSSRRAPSSAASAPPG